MSFYDISCIIGNALTYVLSMAQTNDILKGISFGLSILISLIILISKIIRWWKKAKEDGKITADELDELASIVEEAKQHIDNEEGEKNDKN